MWQMSDILPEADAVTQVKQEKYFALQLSDFRETRSKWQKIQPFTDLGFLQDVHSVTTLQVS